MVHEDYGNGNPGKTFIKNIWIITFAHCKRFHVTKEFKKL